MLSTKERETEKKKKEKITIADVHYFLFFRSIRIIRYIFASILVSINFLCLKQKCFIYFNVCYFFLHINGVFLRWAIESVKINGLHTQFLSSLSFFYILWNLFRLVLKANWKIQCAYTFPFNTTQFNSIVSVCVYWTHRWKWTEKRRGITAKRIFFFPFWIFHSKNGDKETNRRSKIMWYAYIYEHHLCIVSVYGAILLCVLVMMYKLDVRQQ